MKELNNDDLVWYFLLKGSLYNYFAKRVHIDYQNIVSME